MTLKGISGNYQSGLMEPYSEEEEDRELSPWVGNILVSHICIHS
jgi:hypothetical protein